MHEGSWSVLEVDLGDHEKSPTLNSPDAGRDSNPGPPGPVGLKSNGLNHSAIASVLKIVRIEFVPPGFLSLSRPCVIDSVCPRLLNYWTLLCILGDVRHTELVFAEIGDMFSLQNAYCIFLHVYFYFFLYKFYYFYLMGWVFLQFRFHWCIDSLYVLFYNSLL